MKTVLITGASSGFGLETAKLFLDKGWKVVATMRTPRADILPASSHLRILPLDVTDAGSIQRAVAEAGPVDVLVNNAGIGFLNAVEGSPMATVREIFETNTFGTMAMSQAFMPQMRERRAGVIINVTSSVTLRKYSLLSVYAASKAAVNSFSEIMAMEADEFGVKVKVVLPGRAPTTAFAENGRKRIGDFPAPYAGVVEKVFAKFGDTTAKVTTAQDVAEAIFRAATDPMAPMFIPAGPDAIVDAAVRIQDVTEAYSHAVKK